MIANINALATFDNITFAVDKGRPKKLSQNSAYFAYYAKNQPILRLFFRLFDGFVDLDYVGCSCLCLVFVTFHYILQNLAE